MRLPPLAISILACAGMLACSHAETRTFIDQSGRALEGELVNVSGPMVTIKRASDGQMFTMPANSFSKSDQAYIGRKASVMPAPTAAPNPPAKTAVPAGSNAAAAPTAPMRMEVKVYPNNNDKPTNNLIDDRIARVGFRIDIRNGEQQRSFNNGRVTMMAFAKNLEDSKQSKTISREDFDVSLEPLKSATFDTKEVKLTYDNIGYKYGYKYSGYLCVLKDQAGKTVSVVGSSPTVEKFADEALSLKVGQIFDKNFKKAGK